jgi:hypothetical protein
MAKTNKSSRIGPTTSASVEQELISLAVKQARQQLIDGTAPASTVNYFLKLAGTREVIEREMLEKQVALLEAKADSIKRSEVETQAYLDAIDAIKHYGDNANFN